MTIKPNNPIIIILAIGVIAAAISFIEMQKPQIEKVNNSIQNISLGDEMKKQNLFQKAPELQGLTGYINTDKGISIANLKGKVVLIDFWTYSCINCIRTLPYVTAWDEKYRDKGLVIIGVHTPEFDFEKKIENVKNAVEKYGIKYPVVLDSSYNTWNAYQNQYWPRHYLIDADGFIRFDHAGEGGYEETEQQIQQLLMERDSRQRISGIIAANVSAKHPGEIGTPEIYLGYAFARQPLGNKEGFKPEEVVNYTTPDSTQPNLAYFIGSWRNNGDSMQLAGDEGGIILNYQASDANIVAGGKAVVEGMLDDKNLTKENAGDDIAIKNGIAIAKTSEERLYNIVSTKQPGQHILKIKVSGKGFKIYTFTFG